MSFWRLNYHIVWGTKNREPFITPEIEPILYSYIIKKASELSIFVHAINGIEDHMHLIVSIPPKVSISDAVKSLKGASSYYINNHQVCDFSFAWQRGYGVLTIGDTQKQRAIEYVDQQKQHHAKDETNKWLERFSEIDEGPKKINGKQNVIAETKVDYEIWNDFPFKPAIPRMNCGLKTKTY